MTSIEEHRPFRTRTALLIVDAQVGLVELMPAEVQRSVLPRIRALIGKHRLVGQFRFQQGWLSSVGYGKLWAWRRNEPNLRGHNASRPIGEEAK
jgi:hypothetical protein